MADRQRTKRGKWLKREYREKEKKNEDYKKQPYKEWDTVVYEREAKEAEYLPSVFPVNLIT